MGVIFDSSEIISLERDRTQLAALVSGREDEPFGISVVTAAELLHGVERADTEARRLQRRGSEAGISTHGKSLKQSNQIDTPEAYPTLTQAKKLKSG